MKSQFKSNPPTWPLHILPTVVALGTALLSLVLLILGFNKPFYTVPSLGEDQILVVKDSPITIYFKYAILIYLWVLIFHILLLFLQKVSPRKVLLRGSLNLFLCTITYPTLLLFLDPNSVGDCAWMQQQHDNMTWLGGDIYRAHSERSINSGAGVNAQDPPLRLAVFKPPVGGLGIERLDDWISWVGYGPSWTQFFGKGWSYTALGYLFLLLSLLGSYWRLSEHHTRALIKGLAVHFLSFTTLYIGLIVLVYSISQSKLSQAKVATSQGEYQEAYNSLKEAISLIPALSNDSGIIHQLGYYQGKMKHLSAPEHQLYQILWLDKRGYHDRSRALLHHLWSQPTHGIPRYCAREMARHQLRIAINDLNSGKLNSCEAHLNKLLKREPLCIQGLFHKQLVSQQKNDLPSLRASHEQLISLYDHIKSKNKRGVLATSALMRAQAEAKVGNTTEAWFYRLKSKGM